MAVQHLLHPTTTFTNTPDERGVLIVVQDEEWPPAVAFLLRDALHEAGIKIKFDTASTPMPEEACAVAVSHKVAAPQ